MLFNSDLWKQGHYKSKDEGEKKIHNVNTNQKEDGSNINTKQNKI